MRPSSTFVKLFLGNLLAMVAILSLAGLAAYRRLDRNYQAESRDSQDRLARLATAHFQALWPQGPDGIDAVCKGLLADPAMRLTVVADDGAVLGDSTADPRRMANHKTADRPELLAALDGHSGLHERRSETTGIVYRYLARPLRHEGRVVAAVRLAVPVKTIAEGGWVLRRAILWSSLGGMAAAVVLGLLTSWLWYAPLRRITRAARQIASGDLTCPPGGMRGGGLGELAAALNEVRHALGQSLGQIASQHQDFQTVLANLREGVVAVDAAGQVVLMNRAAGELLSVDSRQAVGKPLGSAVQVLEVLELPARAAAADAPRHVQFDAAGAAGRRTLEAHAATVPPGPSNIACLLVLRDVTELSAAAAMKAQFVANASHELRTPVATLRAAVDSLASADAGDPNELPKLAAVLDRHLARLEEMTRDLLDLHAVESPRFPLRTEDLALGDLAEWVRSQFAALAREKGLAFSVSAPRPAQRLSADRKLLELILSNLVDNAIKFTAPGGSVRCEVEGSDAGVCLRIGDSGCGIAPADQPRVFERFYQSDAARSGPGRGSGLGLAIVKHAAERLGARIELQSQPGRGTTVAVLLPPPTPSRAPGHAPD